MTQTHHLSQVKLFFSPQSPQLLSPAAAGTPRAVQCGSKPPRLPGPGAVPPGRRFCSAARPRYSPSSRRKVPFSSHPPRGRTPEAEEGPSSLDPLPQPLPPPSRRPAQPPPPTLAGSPSASASPPRGRRSRRRRAAPALRGGGGQNRAPRSPAGAGGDTGLQEAGEPGWARPPGR